MKKIFYFICFLSFVMSSSIIANVPHQKKYLPHTALSKKALKLKVGMTREEVYKLLGQPTWGQSYEGQPLDWTWRNGKCNPVDVTFDENLRVNGFDEGRVECDTNVYTDVPSDKHLCSNPDVKKLCDPKTKLIFTKPKAKDLKKAIVAKV